MKKKKKLGHPNWWEWHPTKTGAYPEAQNGISFENGVFKDVISGEVTLGWKGGAQDLRNGVLQGKGWFA